MDFAPLLAFTATAALLTVTPGLDTALVLRTAASEGPRRAMMAALGIAAGCLAWGILVALGLGALLAASELAYTILRWVGAAYLLWLGLKLIRSTGHGANSDLHQPPIAPGAAWLRRGFLTNILNPKVGVFYVSFLPQFIPPGADVAVWTVIMTSIHACLGLVWFSVLVAVALPIADVMRGPKVMAWLDRITGGVFVAFGVKLAAESGR